MGQRAQPLIKTLAGEQVTGNPPDLLMSEALHALPSLRAMPLLAEDLALQARAGRLTVRSERFATGDRDVVDGWIDRVLFVVIGVVGIVTGALLVGAGVLAEGSQVSRYLLGLGFTGLFLATAMLLREVAQIQGRRRSGRP
jgi:hypothetical protein